MVVVDDGIVVRISHVDNLLCNLFVVDGEV